MWGIYRDMFRISVPVDGAQGKSKVSFKPEFIKLGPLKYYINLEVNNVFADDYKILPAERSGWWPYVKSSCFTSGIETSREWSGPSEGEWSDRKLENGDWEAMQPAAGGQLGQGLKGQALRACSWGVTAGSCSVEVDAWGYQGYWNLNHTTNLLCSGSIPLTVFLMTIYIRI